MKKIITSLLLLLSATGFSQSTMNIHKSNGTLLQIPLNTIDSVTYTINSNTDTIPPVITIVGGLTTTISLQGTFTNLGATALDNIDGNISFLITTTGSVNVDSVGTYLITYSVSDNAGNSSTAIRTVYVVNDAYYLAGTYNVTDVSGGNGPWYYADIITASTSINNRIKVNKFADYMGASVYMLISGTNVTIPSQTINCGNPAENRTFSGSGTCTTTTLSLNYTVVTNGNTITGTDSYAP